MDQQEKHPLQVVNSSLPRLYQDGAELPVWGKGKLQVPFFSTQPHRCLHEASGLECLSCPRYQ